MMTFDQEQELIASRKVIEELYKLSEGKEFVRSAMDSIINKYLPFNNEITHLNSSIPAL